MIMHIYENNAFTDHMILLLMYFVVPRQKDPTDIALCVSYGLNDKPNESSQTEDDNSLFVLHHESQCN